MAPVTDVRLLNVTEKVKIRVNWLEYMTYLDQQFKVF